jgi:hypothetical protein
VGAVCLGAGAEGGAAFLAMTGERTRPVRRGTPGMVFSEATSVSSIGASTLGPGGSSGARVTVGGAEDEGGGSLTGMSGLVQVPRDTRGESEGSFGGVSIVGAIGDGGCSWEIRSMRGVDFGLERREASGLDMDLGAVGVVGRWVSAEQKD